MSTRELLKQFRALSDADRARLLAALLTADDPRGGASARPRAGTRVKWPNVEARARRIFGRRRALPNLVVLERRRESC